MFRNKGVKAIYLEYMFTLEASNRTRFQGKVTRFRCVQRSIASACIMCDTLADCEVAMVCRNELEREVRRIGLAQRQEERQQERQGKRATGA